MICKVKKITKGEGDGIESRLPFKIFYTLPRSKDSTLELFQSRVFTKNDDVIPNSGFGHQAMKLS